MTLSDYQVEFNGVTVGCDDGTYILESVVGLDDFDVRSNDQVLPSLWGSQAGGDFVEARDFVIGVLMYTADAAWADLQAAWLPPAQSTPTDLTALTFKFPDLPELQTMCRVRRRGRARTGDTEGEAGWVQWYYEFNAPDPRLYSAEEYSAGMTSYVADSSGIDSSTGSGADLAVDGTVDSGADLAIDATGTTGGGGIAVTNAGNVDTFPTFSFATSASMAIWHVVNDTTGEEASFAFALVPGYTLTANMAGVGTGSTITPILLNDEPNYALWESPRVPVRLVPGDNDLRFFVDSGTASGSTCTVAWRDAYL